MLQFFVFRLKNAVTSNFVVQLLHHLKVKGLYFFGSPLVLQEAKKIQKVLEKDLMSVIKFRSFDPLFLENKEKQNLRSLKIYVQPLSPGLALSLYICMYIHRYLLNFSQECDILLIS